MIDEDLEQLLLGFDAIRSAQAVPPRWSAQWDERLKRGHEVLRGAWHTHINAYIPPFYPPLFFPC